MVNTASLADKVIELLSDKVDSNYRIAVLIVGPPGSGKSTISEEICEEVNARFQAYLSENQVKVHLQDTRESSVDICEGIPFASSSIEKITESEVFSHVEDEGYVPHKYNSKDGATIVVGRGGLPNSIQVKHEKVKVPNVSAVRIAQIVPMDGFHLSRKCLDHFKNPLVAHQRRGSPQTFDSNNYLQLCKLLAETCEIKPHFSPSKSSSNVFDKLCASFSDAVPSIYVPGFDHSLKDPSKYQHCINAFTRVLVLEGLYLLLDVENWREIYPIMKSTDAIIICNIDIDEKVIEQRVARRHVISGLAQSLEEGLERFRANDLLNARLIKKKTIEADDIITIRND